MTTIISTQVYCISSLQRTSPNYNSTIDIKSNIVFVTYGQGGNRYVHLGDCGNTVPDDSPWAGGYEEIGAPIWRSPEATLQMGWDTLQSPTDIWSFNTMVSKILASSTRTL